MATKAVNIKLDERKVTDVKNIGNVFHMTITDIISDALDEYIRKMKKDPFYRLTVNAQNASAKESGRIITMLGGLSDDDLTISQGKVYRA